MIKYIIIIIATILAIIHINNEANKFVIDIQVPEPVKIYRVFGNNEQVLVAKQIIKVAEEENFNDISMLLNLAWCESRLNKDAFSSTGDRGVFQINNYWHKDISDKQAYDVDFSTRWTINMINKGYQHRWSCYNKIYVQK